MRFYSIIIPVYNRPDEIAELLASLKEQEFNNFEVLIIEDGSDQTCKAVVDQYAENLNIQYHFKENSGQGFSRNFGFGRANGDYLLVFDSDCLLPKNYLQNLDDSLNSNYLDAFGGPDKAAKDFTLLQKAINYSMTSTFTTGGIRGHKNHSSNFHPRSFNMGISKVVFEKTGGYKITRMGEDLEFSLRIISHGFKVGLIEEAFVFHKRRTNLRQFYKQLHFFGRARINVTRFYPGSFKLLHLFPLIFLLGWLLLAVLWFINPPAFSVVGVLPLTYLAIIFIDCSIKNRNLIVGVLSIIATITQFLAYAIGMSTEYLMRGTKHQAS